MTQALAAIGLDELLQYIVLFAIFILPGIKASRDAKKKKQQHSRRKQPASPSPGPSAAPEPGKPSGAELWERLLRGEIDPAAPPPPVPAPAVEKRVATKRRKPEPPKLPTSKPRPQPIVREPLSAPMGEAKEFAQLPHERPVLPRAASENALETGVSALEESLAQDPSFGSPLGDSTRAVDSRPARAPAYEPISIKASSSRDDWRRAIVLTEVLGTPVALRKSHGSLPGLS